MTTETSKNKLILKGRENYLEWSKRFEAMAITEEWGNIEAGIFTPQSTAKEKDAKKWVIMNLSDEAISPVIPSAPLQKILEKLNEVFGYANYNSVTQKQLILSFIEFPIIKDPTQIFLWFDKQLDILTLSGGNVDNTFVRQAIDTGLQCTMNPNSVYIENTDFWATIRGRINELEESEFDYTKVKKSIYKFWQANRNKRIQVDTTPFVPAQKLASANNANGRPRRKCDYCDIYRKRIAKSHNTDKCFFGDKEGWTKNAFAVEESLNTSDSTYVALFSHDSAPLFTSKIFYDTGCTPFSYFKDKPLNCIPKLGKVNTASNESVTTMGIGEVRIGNLIIKNVVHAPSFKYNLLSGIQIMNLGYIQIIKDGELKIIDKLNNVLAIGKFNPYYGLIEIIQSKNLSLSATNSSLENWHKRLAHFNTKTVFRNLKLQNINTDVDIGKCTDCIKSKLTSQSTSKFKDTKDYEILEMVESDTTPFPITSYDGFSFNIKFVCRKSGFIYMSFIKDLKSVTCLNEFRIFKEKYENVTGKKIKYIRTDGGSEYKGSFNDFLLSNGIIKEFSTSKHQPARAERAHRTILELSRSCHSSSKLPLIYYSDAQRYAAYTLNHVIRDDSLESPFYRIYKRIKNFNNFKEFGSICYIHVPKSKNVNGKLDSSGVRCRFLGYGDDESLIERRYGFKILRESDRKVLYSNDVYFSDNEAIEPLDEHIENYSEFYASLKNQALEDLVDKETEEITELETEDNDQYQKLNEAIQLGHIDNTRGSGEVDCPMEDIISIAREANLTVGTVINSELYSCFSAAMTMGCPETYEEAINSNESEKWKEAMKRELESIKKNDTWDLVKLDNVRKKPIKCRWVFTKKFNKFGEVKKFKARLVAKGYTQKAGIDYWDTFSPVIKFKSVRALLAIAAAYGLNTYQDDVPNAFLKGELQEEVLMMQPPGFEEGDDQTVCRLNKTLYGLKQSPREWNQVIDKYLKSTGFKQSKVDTCLYFRNENEKLILIGVYVDDILTVGKGKVLENFREELRNRFEISEGGDLEWYLGMAINKREDGAITLDQTVYINQKLEEFKEYMDGSKHSSPLPKEYQSMLIEAEKNEQFEESSFPYRKIVGSLMYAMLGSRPDLACAVSVVSQFLDKPKPTHIKLVKRILGYLSVNRDVKLVYKGNTNQIILKGYADASYANEVNYLSRIGYGFMINDSLISWVSTKQKNSTPAQSAAEAEYYAAVSAANEAMCIREVLNELGFSQGTIKIYEDNQACIALTKDPQDHKRTKHIQVRYHVVRDYVNQKLIEFVYCPTENQLADMFTKGVSGVQLRSMMKGFGIINFKSQGES